MFEWNIFSIILQSSILFLNKQLDEDREIEIKRECEKDREVKNLSLFLLLKFFE